MSCVRYTNSEFKVKGELAAQKAIKNFIKSEDKSITTLVYDYLKSLKDSGLFELTHQSELDDLSNTLEEIINKLPERLLPSNIKQNVLRAYKTELSDLFFKNLDTTFTSETSEMQVEEAKSAEYIPEKADMSSYKLDSLYEELSSLKEYALSNFKRAIIDSAIVNFDKGTVVKGELDFNNNIADYKNKLANNLYQYLISKYSTSNIKPYIYENGKIQQDNLTQLLDLAANEFNSVSKYQLKQANLAKYELENKLLVDAYNAFVLLNSENFDEVLFNVLKTNIKIKPLYRGSEVDTDKLKYVFQSHSNTVKNFRTSEMVDAISETSDVARLLIEGTPVLDYRTKTPIRDTYVSLKEFNGTFNKLTDEANYIEFAKYGALTENNRRAGELLKEYAINFHSSPRTYLKRMLEVILNPKNLNTRNTGIFTTSDLNIFQSIYHKFYDLTNPNSLDNILKKDFQTSQIQTGYNLLEVISGVVDRSRDAYYTQYSIDPETKTLKSTKLKRVNTVGNRIRMENAIEIANQDRHPALREKLIKDWGIKVQDRINGHISFVIGDKTVKFTNKGFDIVGESDAWTLIEEPSFDKLRDYYEKGKAVSFSPAEINYNKMLEFIDSFLDTGFLKGNIDLLSAVKSVKNVGLNAKKSVKLSYLTDMLKLADKVAFINSVYKDFNTSKSNNLWEFVSTNYPYFSVNVSKDGGRYAKYYYDRENNALKAINESTLNLLNNIVKGKEIVTGEVYKTVSKDAFKNNIANNRMQALYSLTKHYIQKIRDFGEASSVSNNIVVTNPDMIMGTSIKLDAINKEGITKQVSNFSVSELAHTSIINDFYGKLLSEDTRGLVDIQPTVQSDKTSFILWTLNLNTKFPVKNSNGEIVEVPILEMSTDQLNELMYNTVGDYYRKEYSNVLDVYKKAFTDEFLIDLANRKPWIAEIIQDAIVKRDFDNAKIEEKNAKIIADNVQKSLNNEPVQNPLSIKSISDYFTFNDFKLILENTTYNEFDALTIAKRLPNIDNVHSSKSGKFLKPNLMLHWFANNVYGKENSKSYQSHFLRERKKFIKDLLDNNTNFYLTAPDGTQNAILKEAMSKYIPEDELLNWIDPNIDKLILARDSQGNIITRETGISSGYLRNKENITLNPLLEKYFMTFNVLANNMRLVTTGSAIAHPAKIKSKKIGDISVEEGLTENFMELEQSAREIAQHKRNVIISATSKLFHQNSPVGIPRSMKIAIMSDVPAYTFDFKGKSDSIDSMDGSTWMNPLWSILENLSLQGDMAGDDKKPIVHDFDILNGTAVLEKFATFSMYNERMRRSLFSDIKLYNLFRKMSDQNWNLYSTMPIDLTKNLFGNPMTLQDMSEGQRVIYRNGNKHREILSIQKGEGDNYIFTEQEVNINGDVIPGTTELVTKTINSLFSLHAALGGVFSESMNSKGELEYSDSSLNITVNYINNIGQVKDINGEMVQDNLYQPLKTNMIAGLTNKSAIKVGAQHINSVDAWFDDSIPLKTMTMSTEGAGIQMDADHHAESSQMTEFSQVISSLEANGWTHSIAKRTYQNLGRVASSAIADKSDAVKKWLEDNNKTQIYEIIGKSIIKSFKDNEDKARLTQAIIKKIDEEFKKKNIDHIDDFYKIPFSDPSLFASSLSSLASTVNKDAIKRKYSGLGAVMVPAYNIMQHVLIDGLLLTYDDVLEIASSKGQTVDEYLLERQTIENANFINNTIDLIEPGDYVKIVTVTGETVERHITDPKTGAIKEVIPEILRINTYGDYSRIKETYNNPNYRFIRQVRGRDLRPARITWKTLNGQQINIFDMPAIEDAFKLNGNINLEQSSQIQNTFNLVRNGVMPLTNSMKKEYLENSQEFVEKYGVINPEVTDVNQILIPITNLKNEPAELIISKIYAEKFGISNNDTLYKILSEGANFFVEQYDKYHTSKVSSSDLVFTRGNGRHVYIAFDQAYVPVKNVDVETINENNFIYRTTEDTGRKLYPIQKWNKESQKWERVITVKRVANSDTYEELLIVHDPSVLASIFNSDNFDSIQFNPKLKKEKEIGAFIQQIVENNDTNRYYLQMADLWENRTSYTDFVNTLAQIEDTNKQEIAKKKFVSFQKSLDYVAARIPAQTLQSFMKMKVASFVSSDKNVAYVTHWQTWLQGSDYDIDKAYIMGNEFDNNGIYLSWSPLFNFNSIESLNASEDLPTPNGIRSSYNPAEDALDITNYINSINVSEFLSGNPIEIEKMVELLDEINNKGNDHLTHTSPDIEKANEILRLVNKHNLFTYKNSEKQLASYKNAISSGISKVIQDLRNMTQAYSPIEMKVTQEAGAKSKSGQDANTTINDNPGSIWKMQVQNMAGKKVIGIAATGEKIFFANCYYFNEGVRSNDPEWWNNMRFSKVFNMLQTDSNGKYIPSIKNIIANVNFEGLTQAKINWAEIIRESIEKDFDFAKQTEAVKQAALDAQLELQEDQSLVISALLSSATDNAKELILSKINAGPDLAGMYMHMIMMGFDFSRIADFMTSPTVQLINDLLQSNMFDDFDPYQKKVNDVIKLIQNGPQLSDYVSNKELDKLHNADMGENIASQEDLASMSTDSPVKLKYLESKAISSELLKIVKKYNTFVEQWNFIVSKITSPSFNRAQFEEFVKIRKDAEETTLLGSIYGANQGLATDMVGKMKILNNIESAISNREALYDSVESMILDKPWYTMEEASEIVNTAADLNITNGFFNFRKFLNDSKYRKATIDYYNLIKAQWNIFDMITRIPHFRAIYDAYNVVDVVDQSISNKYKLISQVREALIEKNPKFGRRLTDVQLKSLETYVDDIMILNWLRKNNYSFTIGSGEQYFDNSGHIQIAETDETFNLATSAGRATFKLWMEQKIIPDLKNGIVEGKTRSSLLLNPFVSDLQMNRRLEPNGYQVSYAKLPIDLMKIKSESDQVMLEAYKDGFKKLNKMKIGNNTIADLFFLYNLIVNKNRYGSDRLTSLFNAVMLDKEDMSIIMSYQKSIGESDYVLDLENGLYNIEDALMAIAPRMTRAQAIRSQNKYVKVYNPTTKKYELSIREGKDYLSIEAMEDIDLLKTYKNYHLLEATEYENQINNLAINLETDTKETLIDKIKNLIGRNTLNLTIDCK